VAYHELYPLNSMNAAKFDRVNTVNLKRGLQKSEQVVLQPWSTITLINVFRLFITDGSFDRVISRTKQFTE